MTQFAQVNSLHVEFFLKSSLDDLNLAENERACEGRGGRARAVVQGVDGRRGRAEGKDLGRSSGDPRLDSRQSVPFL